MLGKGLESLIPPIKQNQSADTGQKAEQDGVLIGGAPIQPTGRALSGEPISEPVNFAADREKTKEPTGFQGLPLANEKKEEAENLSWPDISKESNQSFKKEENQKEEALTGDLSLVNQLPAKITKFQEDDLSKRTGAIFQIEIEKIKPNPYQPRRHFDEGALRELASSIREFGIIQPLVLSKVLKETDRGTEVEYQLIAGERRLLAAKMVGLRTVPSIIRTVSAEREKLELAVIENLQRTDLNPVETARAYARLQDEFGLTQREIASRLGKSRETVANAVRLLGLPSEIQAALEEGKINESQGRLLLQINDIAKQREIFRSLLEKQPTVRELRQKIKKIALSRPAEIEIETKINPTLIEFKSRLEEALGTKVNIRDEGNKGKVVIDFYSLEELSHLVEKIIRQSDNQSL